MAGMGAGGATRQPRAVAWRAWLAVALWAGLILRLSGDDLSAASTSRLLGPLLRWIFPELDAQTLQTIHFIVRKAAHFLEYAVLGALAIWALRRSGTWSAGRRAGLALALVAAVAALDEGHQSRSTRRTGSPWDAGLDGAGGVAGIALATALGRRRAAPARPPGVGVIAGGRGGA